MCESNDTLKPLCTLKRLGVKGVLLLSLWMGCLDNTPSHFMKDNSQVPSWTVYHSLRVLHKLKRWEGNEDDPSIPSRHPSSTSGKNRFRTTTRVPRREYWLFQSDLKDCVVITGQEPRFSSPDTHIHKFWWNPSGRTTEGLVILCLPIYNQSQVKGRLLEKSFFAYTVFHSVLSRCWPSFIGG